MVTFNDNQYSSYLLQKKSLINLKEKNIKRKFVIILNKLISSINLFKTKLKFYTDTFIKNNVYDEFFQFPDKDIRTSIFIKEASDLLFFNKFPFLVLTNQSQIKEKKFLYNLFIQLKTTVKLDIDYILSFDLFDKNMDFETFTLYFIIKLYFLSFIFKNKNIIVYVSNLEKILFLTNINKTIENLLFEKYKGLIRFRMKYNYKNKNFVFSERKKDDINKISNKYEYILYHGLFILNKICNSFFPKNLKIICSLDLEEVKKRKMEFNSDRFNILLNKQKTIPFVDIKYEEEDESEKNML